MSFDNDEESLKFINRLLERLHRADYKAYGSININIYKPGSQHVDRVENQYFYSDKRADQPKAGKANPRELPEALSTEQALTLWRKAQRARLVDDNYQPRISRTQSALLADAMAERLGIKEKWRAFGVLWNRNNMRGDYNDALNQRQSLEFRDKQKTVFAD